jgi:prepilin-type N-terminal cleavage/methylation domain-containing protein
MALTSDRRGFTLVELLVTSAITLMILGIVAHIVVQSSNVYRAQRQFMDARDNVAATLDMIVRVVRMADTITPDPENDGVMNSIRVQADWNPRNGVLTDPYETITFWSDGQQLMKQEPSDASAVAFAERIQAISFTYVDTNDAAIANPVTSASRIAYVNIAVQTTPVGGVPSLTLTSAAAVRGRE